MSLERAGLAGLLRRVRLQRVLRLQAASGAHPHAVRILDDPDAFPAGFHDHREEKLRWLEVDAELPGAPGAPQG